MMLALDNGPEIPSGLQAFSLPIPPVCHPPELRCASASASVNASVIIQGCTHKAQIQLQGENAIAITKCKRKCKCHMAKVHAQSASASAVAEYKCKCNCKVQVRVRV